MLAQHLADRVAQLGLGGLELLEAAQHGDQAVHGGAEQRGAQGGDQLAASAREPRGVDRRELAPDPRGERGDHAVAAAAAPAADHQAERRVRGRRRGEREHQGALDLGRDDQRVERHVRAADDRGVVDAGRRHAA